MIKGSKMSDESKLKMSLARQGENNSFYGKHHSDETKLKNSLAHLGKTPWFGKQHTKESRLKMSQSHTGEIPWNKGIPCSEETKEKISSKLLNREYSEETLQKFRIAQMGSNNGNWKGGKITKYNGYIMVKMPEHSFCDNQGYIAEHRLVMEKYLIRYLLPTEIVHHINGIKDDNRIDNLMLFNSNSEHRRYHRNFKKQEIA